MLKIHSQIVPLPYDDIILEIKKEINAQKELPFCYICFDTDELVPSPCECKALCHIDPCLLQSIDVNRNSACTICKTPFVNKRIGKLLLEIRTTHEVEVAPLRTCCNYRGLAPCNVTLWWLILAFTGLSIYALMIYFKRI